MFHMSLFVDGGSAAIVVQADATVAAARRATRRAIGALPLIVSHRFSATKRLAMVDVFHKVLVVVAIVMVVVVVVAVVVVKVVTEVGQMVVVRVIITAWMVLARGGG